MRRQQPALQRSTVTRSGAHTAAGFAIGVLAMAAGFLFAGTGEEEAPMAEAQQAAETAAAVRVAFDPEARPSASPPPSAERVSFTDGDAALFTHRHTTRVVLPSVGIDAEVRPVGLVYRSGRLEYDVPRVEAGEYAGSAVPGTSGNLVIGGHVAQRGGTGVFTALPNVAAGDVIEVYRGDQIYRYSVVEIRIVAADATDVMGQTQDATVTLITCFPDDNYRDRLVVVGKLL